MPENYEIRKKGFVIDITIFPPLFETMIIYTFICVLLLNTKLCIFSTQCRKMRATSLVFSYIYGKIYDQDQKFFHTYSNLAPSGSY